LAKEGLLVDPKSNPARAKRVLVADRPDGFKAASGRVGQRILDLLVSGPKYPAEMARALGTHHQTVYYHIGRLEKSGLVKRVRSRSIRGGEANLFALASDGYAVEFPVDGERFTSVQSASRSKLLGKFFAEFIDEGEFDGWVVVGSPLQHGASQTQARDGHYAVLVGFALGQFVRLPETFPVKLDVDIRAERLLGSNLIVVGGPRTNTIAEDLNQSLPIRFRQGGFWGSIVDEGGRSYTSELDSVVAKVANPWAKEKTCVVVAGLTGAGTKAAMIGVCNLADELFEKYESGDYAAVIRGADRDGDGKVDSVDVLKRL
jgi:DNA-binding transcriptional ArsR family regulator